MYHYTKFIRDNKDIVILSGDKDSSIAIMNKKDYNKKIDEIINDGIQQGKQKETDDNILKEFISIIPLSAFQKFTPL